MLKILTEKQWDSRIRGIQNREKDINRVGDITYYSDTSTIHHFLSDCIVAYNTGIDVSTTIEIDEMQYKELRKQYLLQISRQKRG